MFGRSVAKYNIAVLEKIWILVYFGIGMPAWHGIGMAWHGRHGSTIVLLQRIIHFGRSHMMIGWYFVPLFVF